jgi:broad specificity phosphatase PhoE
VDDLDEYDLAGLLNRLAPNLVHRERSFAELVETHRGSSVELDRVRSFQRMFEALLTHWIATPLEHAEVESWPTFRARVQRALSLMTERPGRGRRVAAFTSGGFIGTAVSLALAAPDRTALELNWRLRNASLTRLLFAPGRLSLDEFNAVPHLTETAWHTYR